MTTHHLGPALSNLRTYTVAFLAVQADCKTPGGQLSPGGKLLLSARDTLLDAWANGDLPVAPWAEWSDEAFGVAGDIADRLTSDMVEELWAQFIDLAAWSEEPPDGGWPDDLTEAATAALTGILLRLFRNLTNYIHMSTGKD